MIKKYSLRVYTYFMMSNIKRNAYEYPCEEILKVIDVRATLDVTGDKFRWQFTINHYLN